MKKVSEIKVQSNVPTKQNEFGIVEIDMSVVKQQNCEQEGHILAYYPQITEQGKAFCKRCNQYFIDDRQLLLG